MDVVEVVVPVPAAARPSATRDAKASTSTTTSRTATARHVTGTSKHANQESFEEPVTKKRRTSSEVGDDAHLDAVEEEPQSPPGEQDAAYGSHSIQRGRYRVGRP